MMGKYSQNMTDQFVKKCWHFVGACNGKCLRFYLLLSLLSGLTGCATYQSELQESRELIAKGEWSQAAQRLEAKAFSENRDQLVYLLDYASIRHYEGNFKESNRAFALADKLAEKLDYISLSDKSTSFLVTEELKAYQGDTFEKIFINAFAAMNYLQLGDLENALVEARRLNEKYVFLRREGETKKFAQNFYGKYLSALLWEASGDYADAFIAYKEAFEIDPHIGFLKQDLVRTALLSARTEDFKRMKEQFPDIEIQEHWRRKDYGELILVFQEGWGPRKDFSPGNHKLPYLRRQSFITDAAQLEIQGVGTFTSHLVYDVAESAINTLNDDLPALIAKRVAAQVLRDQIAFNNRNRDNGLATAAAWIALSVADRADLRQWSMIPNTIQMVRVYLPKGIYQGHVKGIDGKGGPTGESRDFEKIVIQPRKKTFLFFKSDQ